MFISFLEFNIHLISRVLCVNTDLISLVTRVNVHLISWITCVNVHFISCWPHLLSKRIRRLASLSRHSVPYNNIQNCFVYMFDSVVRGNSYSRRKKKIIFSSATESITMKKSQKVVRSLRGNKKDDARNDLYDLLLINTQLLVFCQINIWIQVEVTHTAERISGKTRTPDTFKLTILLDIHRPYTNIGPPNQSQFVPYPRYQFYGRKRRKHHRAWNALKTGLDKTRHGHFPTVNVIWDSEIDRNGTWKRKKERRELKE